MKLDIRLATKEEELQAVYSFRYSVIVQEMGLSIPTADHVVQTIKDPEDRTGHLFAAYCDQVIIGTARVNFLRDALVEPHTTLLKLGRLSRQEIHATSVSGRFLIVKEYRGTSARNDILKVWFQYCREAGIENDYILVKPKLSALYIRLGFVHAGDVLDHPEIGEVLPLKLRINDLEHLRTVDSPFVDCFSNTTCVSQNQTSYNEDSHDFD